MKERELTEAVHKLILESAPERRAELEADRRRLAAR